MNLLLVTGSPGVGKTTLIRSVVERLQPRSMSGFYTEEVRGSAGRTGFRVVSLDGTRGRLASVGGSGPRVGKYRVDLGGFERVALPALEIRPEVGLYVIDEIGKMECLSEPFVRAVRELLRTKVPILATVALHGGGFIEEVKAHPGADLIEVTRENRDELPNLVAARLQPDG